MNIKSTLIAVSAVAALAVGASSAAQAKLHFDVNIQFPGTYGYGPVYVADNYGYEPECHYVTIKKVKWVNGYKVVKFKKKLVCDTY
jgi:hypothetical protein